MNNSGYTIRHMECGRLVCFEDLCLDSNARAWNFENKISWHTNVMYVQYQQANNGAEVSNKYDNFVFY